MIKISKMADYSVVILGALVSADKELMSAAGLSKITTLPEPTVSKLLKQLSHANLVSSVRGPRGGYKAAREAEEITVEEIVVAIDGPVALTSCVETPDGDCEYSETCFTKNNWGKINSAVAGALKDVTLRDMLNNSDQ